MYASVFLVLINIIYRIYSESALSFGIFILLLCIVSTAVPRIKRYSKILLLAVVFFQFLLCLYLIYKSLSLGLSFYDLFAFSSETYSYKSSRIGGYDLNYASVFFCSLALYFSSRNSKILTLMFSILSIICFARGLILSLAIVFVINIFLPNLDLKRIVVYVQTFFASVAVFLLSLGSQAVTLKAVTYLNFFKAVSYAPFQTIFFGIPDTLSNSSIAYSSQGHTLLGDAALYGFLQIFAILLVLNHIFCYSRISRNMILLITVYSIISLNATIFMLPLIVLHYLNHKKNRQLASA